MHPARGQLVQGARALQPRRQPTGCTPGAGRPPDGPLAQMSRGTEQKRCNLSSTASVMGTGS